MSGINFYPAPVEQAYEQDPRLALAQALIARGTDARPITHWTQGVANLMNQYAGLRQKHKLDEVYGGQAQQYQDSSRAMAQALSGGDMGGAQQAASQSPYLQDMGMKLALANYEQRANNAAKQKATLTPAEAKAMGLPAGGVYQRDTYGGLDKVYQPEQITPYQQAQLGLSGQQLKLTQQERDETRRFHDQSLGMERAKLDATKGPGNLSESEGKAVTYGQRAISANAKLGALEQRGYQPNNMQDRAMAHTPLLGNAMTSGAGQQYNQAKLEFISAILRRDSGATITPQEISTAESTYFPQYGDTPAVIVQKSAARDEAISALRAGSGKGASLIPSTVGGEPVDVGQMPSGTIDWSSLKPHGR